MPKGFGAHHWAAVDARGERRFVTVDELGWHDGTQLRAAFESARRLADAGLQFVVAPLRSLDGSVVRDFVPGLAISLFPWVDGTSVPDGEYQSDDERRAVLAHLARLHACDVDLPARHEDFAIRWRAELLEALDDLDVPWSTGPYAERCRLLLREVRAGVLAGLRRHDELVEQVRASPFVLTHGEPHAGNVLWTDGGPVLVDWDTTLWAPPERDLWQVVAPPHEGPGMALYRLRWDLEEVAVYTAEYRQPHEDTDDTRMSWVNLVEFAGNLAVLA